jgi:ADP-heptose:LPS heptosyltransferase
MYTHRVHRPRKLRARHSVDNQWDLLDQLGIDRPTPERYPVEMALDPIAVEAVNARLGPVVSGNDRLVVLHVSAGNPFRQWPLEAFGEVAARLASSDKGTRIVITSGPSDADAAARVLAAARRRLPESDGDRILDCGEFSLPELRALVERAALYVGGDSGPMHVAATSPVPIVTLYGPTLPTRSAPWRADSRRAIALEVQGLACRPCDQRRCAPGDFRCLGWIRPAQVIEAAEQLLDRRG